ncbi:MAG: hypothetical protein CME71_07135 [Halobacteriovorax sp.]|nr:hypothetical protein [Halobacteriovorax sp.]
MRFLVIALLLLSSSLFAKSMVAKVNLNPMGSFEVKTKRIRGNVIKKGDTLQATSIEVSVKTFDSDNETRDGHLKDKLEVKKFPNIVVEKAIAKGGKGQAIIKMRNISQKVPFTYKEAGNEVQVNFSISLKSFGITGINYMGVGVQDEVKIAASIPLK